MIEYIVKPCRTGAAYEIVIKKEHIKKVIEKIEKMEEFVTVKNDFITILKIKDLQISVLDRGKIIFRGEENADIVKKLFHEIFLSRN